MTSPSDLQHWRWYVAPGGVRLLASRRGDGRWSFYRRADDAMPAYIEDERRPGALLRLVDTDEPGRAAVAPSDLTTADLTPTGETLDDTRE